MSSFTITQASDIDPALQGAAFLAAFSDYVAGPPRLPAGGWATVVAVHGIDLDQSRIALDDTRGLLAFAFACPRPERRSLRLAVMGALPAARGRGIARTLLDDFIGRASAGEYERAELECFAQNTRALAMYTGAGFVAKHELAGYAGVPDAAPSTSAAEVPMEDACAWQDALARELDLPFQATSRSLRARPGPLRAWRCRRAQMIASESGGQLTVLALVDASPGQHDGLELVRAAAAALPGCAFHVPQLQRPDLGGLAFERAGLRRLELHQQWLERELPDAAH